MLYVRPRAVFSETYAISTEKEGSPLTWVDTGWMREAGSFSLEGKAYKLGRENWMSGEFFVACDGHRLAHADKPSALRRSFNVVVSGTQYTLRATSSFTSNFELVQGARRVGSIKPSSLWTRRATADLPEDLSLEVQVFLIWLKLLIWKRSRDSA